MPLASVWIPSYDYARFLPAAIESVLDQTYRELELIVFDDGSTDESYEIASRYAAQDDRVRVLHHAGRVNRGIAATMAAALDESRGDYVCGLAADDTLVPDSLERRIAALNEVGAASFAYGMIEMLEPNGTPTGELIGTAPEDLLAAYTTADPLEAMLIHNYMPGHTVLIRRDLLNRVGAANSHLLYSDWDLWLRLHAHGRAVFVGPPAVAMHRRHPSSMSLGRSATPPAELSRRLDVFRVIDTNAATIGGRFEEPRIRALAALERTWYEYASNNVEEAHAALKRAMGADPTRVGDPRYLLWWIGQHQYAGRAPWLEDALARSSRSTGAIVAEGVSRGYFACWAVTAAREFLSSRACSSLAWGVISNELEAQAKTMKPRVLAACVLRALRKPSLLREQWFLKSLLCATGLWHLALRAREGLGRR